MTLKVLGILEPQTTAAVKKHIETLLPKFKADRSNYSNNRKVLWLNKRYDLLQKTVEPGYEDERLWQFIQRIYPGADLALIGAGDSRINLHRDAAYAAFEARSLTIGNCTWQYQNCYEGMKWQAKQKSDAPIEVYEFESGTFFRFNCKNPHACLKADEGRMSINMWKLK